MAISGKHAIKVELPDELFDRLRDAAARNERPLEAMLVESLALLFGAPQAALATPPAALETLPDAQLWALVYRPMTWVQGARLRQLAAQGRQAALLDEEQAELAPLIDEADGLTLLRSRALLVLRQRGNDVREQLQLGA